MVFREKDLLLLTICSLHFSLLSFILLAKSLAYSIASSSFFLLQNFFRALRHLLCHKKCDITRHWIVGALVLRFLPSLLKGFLTMYSETSSSIQRMKSFWILQILWGLNSSIYSLQKIPYLYFCQVEIYNVPMNWLVSLFSTVPWSITRMLSSALDTFCHRLRHLSSQVNPFCHPTTDSDYKALPFFTQSYFCGCVFRTERAKFVFFIHFTCFC